MTIVYGSKLQVFRGHADRTTGGLEKKDLMTNKHGKVVSKKQHRAGKKTGENNLGCYLLKRSTRRSKSPCPY
jgi:hypothetical protein